MKRNFDDVQQRRVTRSHKKANSNKSLALMIRIHLVVDFLREEQIYVIMRTFPFLFTCFLNRLVICREIRSTRFVLREYGSTAYSFAQRLGLIYHAPSNLGAYSSCMTMSGRGTLRFLSDENCNLSACSKLESLRLHDADRTPPEFFDRLPTQMPLLSHVLLKSKSDVSLNYAIEQILKRAPFLKEIVVHVPFSQEHVVVPGFERTHAGLYGTYYKKIQ